MRHMSFMLTTEQMRARTKSVTRRLGWARLRAGEIVLAVEKGQGLKRGEKVKPIGPIRIVSVRVELLNAITPDDCVREGFPDLSPAQFCEMFRRHNKIGDNWPVRRIEFEFV